MSFSARELRRGMDVFSADGVLLGSVVQIRYLPPTSPSGAASDSASSRHPAEPFTGEALGPMPTAAIGNTGPASQNPSNQYAASAPIIGSSARAPAELLVFRTLVHLDWRTLWPRLRRYPVSLIQHVSHERIVLSKPVRELP